ncbi:DUF2625 domain-containing protein [Campylobacter concisus]|uniref:DUF2625 domain-containing protein n=1 Tax=Campylobacter concisus TaxID=199 RepID=UPI0021563A3A|nr:DUF2625 domain-containing protein [Campylobacter concisus]
MGAFVYECGGIVMDEGCLCMLGSGCEQMKRGIYSFTLVKALAKQGRCLAICSWQTMFCVKFCAKWRNLWWQSRQCLLLRAR